MIETNVTTIDIEAVVIFGEGFERPEKEALVVNDSMLSVAGDELSRFESYSGLNFDFGGAYY